MDLQRWNGVPAPARGVLEGRYVRLEPLDPGRHALDLFRVAAEGGEERYRYLADPPPSSLDDVVRWAETAKAADDPLFFAVVDRNTGRAEGRQALMRIDTRHGVIEVGHVLWGPAIARTAKATEALYLCARTIFETLGYRRFEWKCDNRNEPSKRAALRFGFSPEGVFRHHMVVKGASRDTAWFAMLDVEWPRLKAGYERWLRPENFDPTGRQISRLAF